MEADQNRSSGRTPNRNGLIFLSGANWPGAEFGFQASRILNYKTKRKT
jgi:hypothetical protein